MLSPSISISSVERQSSSASSFTVPSPGSGGIPMRFARPRPRELNSNGHRILSPLTLLDSNSSSDLSSLFLLHNGGFPSPSSDELGLPLPLHHHHHYSVPSTSENVPLLVVNPCFVDSQSQRTGTATTIPFPTPPLAANEKISSGQKANNANGGAIGSRQPRRTISLQTIGTLSTLNSACSSTDALSSILASRSIPDPSIRSMVSGPAGLGLGQVCRLKCEPKVQFDSQPVQVMEWFHNTRIAETQIAKLMERSPSAAEAAGSTNRWYKRVQTVVRHFRDKSNRSPTADDALRAPADANATSLFGMPLNIVQANTADGSPLPLFVHDLMAHIKCRAESAEGIFRKNGVKVRTDEMKASCGRLSASQPMPRQMLVDSQVHELGDLLKQYFRQLPECLITNRVSRILEAVVPELPQEKHFLALHFCILLLPAENREALMLLLCFLNAVARHSATNQMTAKNLSTVWMPNLFRFSNSTVPGATDKRAASNRRMRLTSRRKTTGGMTNGTSRDWLTFEAIKQVLAQMIDCWECLLRLPPAAQFALADSLTAIGKGNLPEVGTNFVQRVSTRNGQFLFTNELLSNLKHQLSWLKKDYFEDWPSWELQRVFNGSQIYRPKANRFSQLKTRVCTSVLASPNLILHTILQNRHLWDCNVLDCQKVGPSGQDFDIVRVDYRSGVGLPSKHTFLARRWTYSEFDPNSLCSLIEFSIGPSPRNNSGTTVCVYESKFLIIADRPGYSRLSYISNVDLRGKTAEWYNLVYREMVHSQIQRLKRLCESRLMVHSISTLV